MLYPDTYVKDLDKKKYRFIEDRINGDFHILFTGNTGTGKTLLANIVYLYVYESNRDDAWFSCEWVHAQEVYREYLDMLHRDPDERKRRIDTCLCRGLSVLDDLGSEPNTDAARQFMGELLCNQHGAIENKMCKRSIITTNLTLQEISDRYGARTYSRLTEFYTIFMFDGEDFRPKMNKDFKVY